MPHEQRLPARCRRSRTQSQRAGNIIRRIQNFVRRSEPRQEQVELGRVVTEAAALLESSAREAPRCVSPHWPAFHTTLLRRGGKTRPCSNRWWSNLMRNGMDAIERDCRERARRQLRVSISTSAESMEVCVTDRGSGVSGRKAATNFTRRSSPPRPKVWAWASISAGL